MKKIILMAVFAAGICSCNADGSSNDTTTSDSAATSTPNIPNVNGNMPDTTNSISLEKSNSDTTTKKGQH